MSNQNLVNSLAFSAAAKTFGQVLSWVTTLLVMRMLSPGDYGVASVAENILLLALIFCDIPVSTHLSRVRNFTATVSKEYAGMCLAVAFSLAAILILTAPKLASLYQNSLLTNAIYIKAAHLMLLPLRIAPEATLLRSSKFKLHSSICLAEVFITAACAFTMARNGLGYLTLLLAPMISTACRVVLCMWAVRSLMIPTIRIARFRRRYLAVSKLTIIAIAFRSDVPIVIAIISLSLSTSEVGVYSSALYWSFTIVGRIMQVINQILIPTFANFRDDKSKINELVQSTLEVLIFCSVPIFFGLSAISQDLVSLVLGEKWLAVVLPLTIVAASMPFRLLQDFVHAPLTATLNDTVMLKIMGLHALFFIGLSYLGAKHSLVALCIGSAISPLILCTVSLGYLKGIVKIDFVSLGKTIGGSLICGTIMWVTVRLMSSLNAHNLQTNFRLAVVIFAGALLYAISASILVPKQFASVRRFLMTRMRR
jgi:teichuronic acid exporter